MRKIFAIGCLMVAGCAQAVPLPKVAVAPDLQEQAEEAVRNSLKDPQSAQFSGLVAGNDPKDGATVVCGYVNARNSFGGYTGRAPFQVRIRGGMPVVEAIDTPSKGIGLASIWCRNNGLLS